MTSPLLSGNYAPFGAVRARHGVALLSPNALRHPASFLQRTEPDRKANLMPLRLFKHLRHSWNTFVRGRENDAKTAVVVVAERKAADPVGAADVLSIIVERAAAQDARRAAKRIPVYGVI